MINRLSSREKVSNEKINEAISTIASNRGASMAQIALAYTRSKDFITAPIIGSTKLESIKDLVEGLKITLDEQEIKVGAMSRSRMRADCLGRLLRSTIRLELSLRSDRAIPTNARCLCTCRHCKSCSSCSLTLLSSRLLHHPLYHFLICLFLYPLYFFHFLRRPFRQPSFREIFQRHMPALWLFAPFRLGMSIV